MPDLPSGTVTLVFTDIEGSTRLLQQLGDAYADALLDHQRLVRAACAAHGGHEVDTQGDAFFLVFPRAVDAVDAVVAFQRALDAHFWPEGHRLRVRVGLHVGEPRLVGERYVGLDVHRAARVAAAGHGGQVLLSEPVRQLVEQALAEGVTLRDLGAHRLKDLAQPEPLYQLVIAGLPADFPPLKTLDRSPNNLPVPPTPLLGREREVEQLRDLLMRRDVRLLTVTGPGGIGKTRLGLQLAAEVLDAFPGGACFVDLTPLRDPELIVPAIAGALGLREVGGRPPIEIVREHLRIRELLLLLDNFEHLLPAGPVVAGLLAESPGLKVLVTSREILHLSGEQEFAVPPLALPGPAAPGAAADAVRVAELARSPAVRLFLERAIRARPDFQLTPEIAGTVAEICRRLDGLPLAIELAASRIRLLPPAALLARLEHRLALLTHGPRDLPARQQTLRQTIAWSYDLLQPGEQLVFRHLAVFAGGCTFDAAERVIGVGWWVSGVGGWGNAPQPPVVSQPLTPTTHQPTPDVLDGIASLVDKSLLRQAELAGWLEEAGAVAEPRWVMLDTIREYGLEQLAANGEEAAVRRRHARFFLELAEAAGPALHGAEQAAWLARLDAEHDNLRAVLAWSLSPVDGARSASADVGGPAADPEPAEAGLRVAGALWQFWQVRGHLSEGRRWLEQLLARPPGTPTAARARALGGAGVLAYRQGAWGEAAQLHEQSLALYRALGDRRGVADALNNLAAVTAVNGAPPEAIALYEESLTLYRDLGDRRGLALSLNDLANVIAAQGDLDRAAALYEESLALYRDLGDTWGTANALSNLGTVADERGDLDRARSLLAEALELRRALGDRLGTAVALHNLGQVASRQGERERAAALLTESLDLFREFDHRSGAALSLTLLGRLATEQGDLAQAGAWLAESLALHRELDDRAGIARCLETLALVAHASGRPAQATRLLAAAQRLLGASGTGPLPVEASGEAPSLAALQAQLGAEGFAAAWAEGHDLPVDAAIALAREPLPQRG